MIKGKTLACYFFLVIILLFALESNAMEGGGETDDETSTGSTAHLTVYDPYAQYTGNGAINATYGSQQDPQSQNLATYLEPITRVSTSPTIERFIKSLGCLSPILPSFTTFVPLATTGLRDVWEVTTKVIPVGDLAYPVLMALPPAVAAGTAVYYATEGGFMSPEPPDVAAARQAVTERPDTSQGCGSFADGVEAWTYDSWGTTFIELAFWGSLYLSMNMDLQSNLDSSWGDYRWWAVGFTALIVPILYFIFVRPTNNPRKSLWRPWTKEGKARQPCLEAIGDVEDIVRHEGWTNKTSGLGIMLRTAHLPEINAGEQVREQNMEEETAEAPEGPAEAGRLAEGIQKEPSYVRIFKEIMTTANQCPEHIKTWRDLRRRISTAVSGAVGLAELPMTYLLSYYLFHQGFTLFTSPGILDSPMSFLHMSREVATGLSIAGTLITAPQLALAALKGSALIRDEVDQLLDWLYKPRLTSNHIGERFAPVLARAAAVIYFVDPVAYFLFEEVLAKGMGIDNPYARIALVTPVAIYVGAASAQFFDEQYTKIANWFAKGGPVPGDKRVFYCFDLQEKKRQALMLLGRLEEIRGKVERLNEDYTRYLNQQTGLISEEEPLLPPQ